MATPKLWMGRREEVRVRKRRRKEGRGVGKKKEEKGRETRSGMKSSTERTREE